MIRYTEVAYSPLEVPGEQSVCIYISGCTNHCKDCHYPELQDPDYGDPLAHSLGMIIEAYRKQATCICFLGEGDASEGNRNELLEFVKYAESVGLKTCLYSGRDIGIEDWMSKFKYVKVGSYKKEHGPLDSRTTNQKFYINRNGEFKDITSIFWEE